MLIEGRRRLVGEGMPGGEVGVLLQRAACDVAVLIARENTELEGGPAGSPRCSCRRRVRKVAGRGAGLAGGHVLARVRLKRSAQARRRWDEGKSVTRMLADAGLLAQQATGIATEPLVVEGGRDGIIAAATGAGLLVIGLSERWKREGLGPTRAEIAKAAPAPVLFVRRGTRPGLFAPKGNVTQFKWSMAGTGPGMLGGLTPPARPEPDEDTPPIPVG